MTIERKANISRKLIWIGLLAWVPYIIMRLLQSDISLTPFLIIHLIGVLGGAFLHRQATLSAPPASGRKLFLKTFSTVLLISGVCVWIIYFGLAWKTGIKSEINPFLITHLSLMISGAGIKLYNFLTNK